MRNPLTWWRHLQTNPVYLREKGHWGTPNPFYEKLRRFSPFVVIGAVIFGLCAGSSNPALLNDEMYIFWCFLCLPGILLNGLTMFVTLMAPALTAPAISTEVDQGTWEILRVTPMPGRTIMLAKLFGALSRLRIAWPILFALSLLQGLMWACSLTIGGGDFSLLGVPLGLTTVLRPWLEIGFAAMAGLYASARMRSATMALTASYTAVFLVKLINSSSLWTGVFLLAGGEGFSMMAGILGPTIIYTFIIGGLIWALFRQAERLDLG